MQRLDRGEDRNGKGSSDHFLHPCHGDGRALLLNIQPGDEVIMPAYTFVSTADAFVLRGATPVFVDIRPDTMNMDEKLIEAAITERTKAIVRFTTRVWPVRWIRLWR